MAPIRPIRVRIHERGDRRLDGILHLIEEAGRPRPLGDVLAKLAQVVAEIARVEVVSIYVLEPGPHGSDGDELVMRANVGFPAAAVGNVRLRVGAGLTGAVAECLRPISLAVGGHDARWHPVPGISEEQFPSFLGVPVLGGAGAAGVLVLQRREVREWPAATVALATALAAPVAYALERARARDAERAEERAPRGLRAGAPATSRTARLEGQALAAGTALGRVDVIPSLEGLVPRLTHRPHERPGQTVVLAFASLARELGRARQEVEARLARREDVLRLRSLSLLLDDERFRDLLLGKTAELGVGAGLVAVAREYARAPWRVPSGEPDGWLSERAAEVEDLCILVGARVLGEKVPALGAAVVTERLTAMLALAALSRRAVAAVVGGPSADSAFAAVVTGAAGLPVVADVAGLFAWTRPDDRILVDAPAAPGPALVRVNPPATAVARFRARR